MVVFSFMIDLARRALFSFCCMYIQYISYIYISYYINIHTLYIYIYIYDMIAYHIYIHSPFSQNAHLLPTTQGVKAQTGR